MRTVFDHNTRDKLISRIGSLSVDKAAQWGRMNVNQMVKHCTLWEEMIHNNIRYPRPFIGHLLGRTMLKKEMKDDSPMRRNNPTIPQLIIRETNIDLEEGKRKWMDSIRAYEYYSYPDYSFIHPFFGKMTREQVGYHAYKHTDHHLRQFSC